MIQTLEKDDFSLVILGLILARWAHIWSANFFYKTST